MEDEKYQVVGQCTPDIPAYKVQNLDWGKSRILPRDLLLPLQGKLRQEGKLEKENTSVTDVEDDEITEVPSVSILPKVRSRRGVPLLLQFPIREGS